MKPPSKRLQLLAHLGLRQVPLASIPRLLNLTKIEAMRLVANMERDGLIEIQRYPEKIDPRGKCDRVAIKQQDQKTA